MVTWGNIRTTTEGEIALDAVRVELELEIFGYKCFVYRREYSGDYRVTERASGFAFGEEGETVQDAIDKARAKAESAGPERFKEKIDIAVAKYGRADE